jgi:hypothetical protein
VVGAVVVVQLQMLQVEEVAHHIFQPQVVVVVAALTTPIREPLN